MYRVSIEFRNTSVSFGEREMLWEHEPQASVFAAFSSSPNFHEYYKISRRKKENQLV